MYTQEQIDYSYQPQSFINNNIHKDANINSNWSYRRYIQKNANDIMKHNTMCAINASGNNPYVLINNQIGPNIPYLYTNSFDSYKSNYDTNNSDLKQNYLNQQQIKARMVSPSIPTNKL
jgi:hypothetical protein